VRAAARNSSAAHPLRLWRTLLLASVSTKACAGRKTPKTDGHVVSHNTRSHDDMRSSPYRNQESFGRPWQAACSFCSANLASNSIPSRHRSASSRDMPMSARSRIFNSEMFVRCRHSRQRFSILRTVEISILRALENSGATSQQSVPAAMGRLLADGACSNFQRLRDNALAVRILGHESDRKISKLALWKLTNYRAVLPMALLLSELRCDF
jgi:hypothetical protein